MRIESLETGRRGVVARVDGASKNRLLDLGIVPGIPIRVVQGASSGPMILEVLGSKVVIGQGLAAAIEIA
jgi:Fe2+ transport system protein FeoA